jgi:4-alpha-glucanotransferase
MKFERRSGILLHPTSLPGKYGIGDLSSEALNFIDFLYKSGQTYWQLLPLSPPDFSNSPYDGLSAFAGNPILISPGELLKSGYLTKKDLNDCPHFPQHIVDFDAVIKYKAKILELAYKNFKSTKSTIEKKSFDLFCKNNNYWLDDFTLFIALMRHHDNLPWFEWDNKTKHRDLKTLLAWKKELADDINKQKFYQWQFFKQWLNVKQYANEKGIKIIGDIPIFVSMNSADVWANNHLFYFNNELKPTVVSGVPPDYFSDSGQLWGHPLYNWDAIKKNNYKWWISRFQMALTQSDIVRIDHFRGLYNYWEVKAEEETAINGSWKVGPGEDLFNVIIKNLGDVQIIAENLGDFDEESRIGVENLRKKFTFPGMKILQFAFGSDSNDPFLPQNFTNDYVVYTGTHDNDTTVGWYTTTSTEKEQDFARRYMAVNGSDIAWDLIRLGWSSVADTAITTVQDLLGLGHDARMNTPSTVGPKNWSWRFCTGDLSDNVADRLYELTNIYNRLKTK